MFCAATIGPSTTSAPGCGPSLYFCRAHHNDGRLTRLSAEQWLQLVELMRRQAWLCQVANPGARKERLGFRLIPPKFEIIRFILHVHSATTDRKLLDQLQNGGPQKTRSIAINDSNGGRLAIGLELNIKHFPTPP